MMMKSNSTPQPAQQPSKADQDNRANQLNREHDAYWQSRGLPGKPESAEPPPALPPKKQ
jgi:hypothetical protein